MINEQARWFGPQRGLFGILCLPAHGARVRDLGIGLMNPGNLHRVGGARLNVRLARHLARLGYPSIRFDFSGLGDSAPRTTTRPYLESMAADVREALDCLSTETGIARFGLIGHCSGAAVSYVAALSDARVCALIQIEGFAYRTRRYQLHRWRRILTNTNNWRDLLAGRKDLATALRNRARALRGAPTTAPLKPSDHSLEEARRNIGGLSDLQPSRDDMRRGLARLIERRVRMLNIFGGGDHHYYSYREQFADAFPGLDFGELLEVEHVPGANHYFSAQRHQAWLDNRIAETIERTADDLEARHTMTEDSTVSS
jgi:pimeloyl-ACP methyl ester carboxylesterase